MPDPETQTVTPEPGAAPDVPSVNPEAHPVADSESQGTNWVDPLFLERDSAPLPDEIVVAGSEEAAQAAAAETDDAGPSAEQLAELVAQDTEAPESGDAAGKPVKPAAKAKEQPAKGDGDGSDAGSEATAGGDAGSEATDGGDAGSVPADPKDDDYPPRKRARRRELERTRTIEAQAQTIQALQEQIKQATPAAQAEPAESEVSAEPPTLEDHEFDTEKWATAMGEWTKAQVGQAERKAAQAREEEAGKAAAARNQEIMEAFGEREEAARDRHEDYNDVVYDTGIFIDRRAAYAIWQSEDGPEFAYYLATHQDEAKTMAGMSDVDLGRAIAKIEFSLTAAQATETQEAAQAAAAETPTENTEAAAAAQAPADKPGQQAKPAPTPTKAPPPVPTLGGSGAAMRPSVEKMSQDEYNAGRRSGKIR